jgi:hypothetical protein
MKTATIPESGLESEIEAYEALKQDLEANHTGKWVLLKDRKLIDLYESFETAAQNAVRLYGRGPYLIRQVGAPPMILPASVMYQMSG